MQHRETHQPAIVNIIRPDIDECRLVHFCMCMLMHLCCSLPSQLKGRTYDEWETPCHAIHTGTTWHLCLNGRNLGILSIEHGERVINIFKHKSEEIKGIKKRIRT